MPNGYERIENGLKHWVRKYCFLSLSQPTRLELSSLCSFKAQRIEQNGFWSPMFRLSKVEFKSLRFLLIQTILQPWLVRFRILLVCPLTSAAVVRDVVRARIFRFPISAESVLDSFAHSMDFRPLFVRFTSVWSLQSVIFAVGSRRRKQSPFDNP